MRRLLIVALLGCAHNPSVVEPTPALAPCLAQPTHTVACGSKTRVDGYSCALCDNFTRCTTLQLEYCAPSCDDSLCIPPKGKRR